VLLADLLSGDDDDEFREYQRSLLMRSVGDLLGTYSAFTYYGFIETPLVSLAYAKRVMENTATLLSSPSGDNAEKLLRTSSPAFKQVQDIVNAMNE
jgi:hypothetical protein